MKHTHLSKTGERGWFIGSFPEAALQTDLTEVCYRTEPISITPAHYHTKCTETLLIVDGIVKCNGEVYTKGDILIFEPGESHFFEHLTECTVITVKTPAGGHDKVCI